MAAIDDIVSGANNAELYVDDDLVETFGTTIEYSLDEPMLGDHIIKIIAYDQASNMAVAEQKIWIFNL